LILGRKGVSRGSYVSISEGDFDAEWAVFEIEGELADLATETHIYEVDRLANWHEGVGQVLHYRDESGKQGVLVLILPDDYSNWERLEKLERKRCKPYDIALIVLVRAVPPLTAGVYFS